MNILAVSFDLWDTLVFDDSDEPKRAAAGLPSKQEARRDLVWRALDRQAPLPRDVFSAAWDTHDAAFERVWRRHFATWTVRERLAVLFEGLERALPEGELDTLVEALELMEVEIPPDPVPGLAEGLAALQERYPLCIVSDAIYTPGRLLRRMLDDHGVLRCFHTCIFSDEAGRSKPHPRVFDAAAAGLGVQREAIVHVGDRQHNDIAGPQALGMKAVLFVGARAADREGTTADAVCERFSDLPQIIESLDN